MNGVYPGPRRRPAGTSRAGSPVGPGSAIRVGLKSGRALEVDDRLAEPVLVGGRRLERHRLHGLGVVDREVAELGRVVRRPGRVRSPGRRRRAGRTRPSPRSACPCRRLPGTAAGAPTPCSDRPGSRSPRSGGREGSSPLIGPRPFAEAVPSFEPAIATPAVTAAAATIRNAPAPAHRASTAHSWSVPGLTPA